MEVNHQTVVCTRNDRTIEEDRGGEMNRRRTRAKREDEERERRRRAHLFPSCSMNTFVQAHPQRGILHGAAKRLVIERERGDSDREKERRRRDESTCVPHSPVSAEGDGLASYDGDLARLPLALVVR